MLGTVLVSQGRIEEADPILSTVIEKLESADDPNHLMRMLSVRSSMLWQAGRSSDAALVTARLIESGEAGDSRAHRLAALTGRFWMTSHLAKEGRLDEAIQMSERVVEGSAELYGVDSPNHASALIQTARLLSLADRYPDAEPLLHRGIEIVERVFGSRHYELERHLNFVSQMHARGGNADAALRTRTRGLLLRLYIAGPGEADSVEGLVAAGAEALGSDEAWAEVIIEEANSLDVLDPGAAQYLINAGLALQTDERLGDAEHLYHKAADALAASDEPARARQTLSDRLSTFYIQTGREALAERWTRQLSGDHSGLPDAP